MAEKVGWTKTPLFVVRNKSPIAIDRENKAGKGRERERERESVWEADKSPRRRYLQ
jgi:hypothetical protein